MSDGVPCKVFVTGPLECSSDVGLLSTGLLEELLTLLELDELELSLEELLLSTEELLSELSSGFLSVQAEIVETISAEITIIDKYFFIITTEILYMYFSVFIIPHYAGFVNCFSRKIRQRFGFDN